MDKPLLELKVNIEQLIEVYNSNDYTVLEKLMILNEFKQDVINL